MHTTLRKDKKIEQQPSNLFIKARVVGGGGLTNTAVTKEEKRAGYSPKKPVMELELIRKDSPLRTHL